MSKLTNAQILEVEALSMHGCGADTIACHLGLTPGAFRDLADEDERIQDAMLMGRHRGIAAVAKSLFASATSGKDSGAARFIMERIGPAEFKPPRAGPPVIVVEMPKVDPARELERADRIDRMMQRQRLLVSGHDIDADGRVIDLEPAVRKNPPSPGDAGDDGEV